MNFKYIKPEVKLFDNQVSNIKKLIHRRRCILSDKVGGGKSLSVLYAFAILKEKTRIKNMVVLTPLSALEKEVWKKDIIKFTNFKCIDVDTLLKMVGTSQAKLIKVLSQYDIIYGKHTHVKQPDRFDLIKSIVSFNTTLFVVDEIHAFRNPTSSLNLLLRDVAKGAYAFWGITATTISRNIENLYHITNLVYPWFLGPWIMFRDTYCNTVSKVIGYDRRTKTKKRAYEVSSIKDPVGLRKKLEPVLITGESFFEVNYHYLDYTLSEEEQSVYTRIANGISVDMDKDPEEWFKWIMSESTDTKVKSIGDVDKYSSRFIYLQHAADGIIAKDGTYSRMDSTKMIMLINILTTIVNKGQSVLVYFDYLAAVDIAEKMINKYKLNATVLLSTGENRLKEWLLTEARCKQKSHIILCTRAASESTSYYFINNVVFFHNPTVPSTFIQMLGRITRKNSLYPDDLNCYIFRSHNIDLYKLLIVSGKTRLMEIASGEREANVPGDYKEVLDKAEAQSKYRQVLLWQS